MTEIGSLTIKKPISFAQTNIQHWLEKIGVSGLELDVKWDANLNVALIRFWHNQKQYEFKSTKQSNCRLNLFAIARVMEYKVRSHLMKIEDFGQSMKSYLLLENNSPYQYSQPTQATINEKNYVTLGINSLASNTELEKQYKKMAKTFHPDMALSDDAKKEFEKRFAEINTAWQQIKKERGL